MKLTVVHNNIDLTLKMDGFTADVKTIDLTDGPIYVGYYKPLKTIYIELEDRSVTDTLDIEYFNGTVFTNIPVFEDKTFGLTSPGFISWEEVEQSKTTVNSKELYWLKITTATPGDIAINGINLVLSDDNDFGFIPGIQRLLPTGLNSFIGFHEEARKRIVQRIRNSGKVIYGRDDLIPKQVDQFDLLSIEEFRQASKYLALHLIYDYTSKNPEDIYAIKAASYHESYLESLNDRLTSLDSDDDGSEDDEESNVLSFTRIIRA